MGQWQARSVAADYRSSVALYIYMLHSSTLVLSGRLNKLYTPILALINTLFFFFPRSLHYASSSPPTSFIIISTSNCQLRVFPLCQFIVRTNNLRSFITARRCKIFHLQNYSQRKSKKKKKSKAMQLKPVKSFILIVYIENRRAIDEINVR